MIDFHNHVLPNVDDGRKAYDESMAMIRHASYQGITDIVQTIHFQHPKMDNKNVDYDRINFELCHRIRKTVQLNQRDSWRIPLICLELFEPPPHGRNLRKDNLQQAS